MNDSVTDGKAEEYSVDSLVINTCEDIESRPTEPLENFVLLINALTIIAFSSLSTEENRDRLAIAVENTLGSLRFEVDMETEEVLH